MTSHAPRAYNDHSMPAQLDDHFTLGLPLGRNAAGAVWQGEDKRDERTVAIAMVDLEDVEDKALGRRLSTRFRRDLELLRKVDHPNVARVTEVGRDAEGRPFAAMEFVEGENLGDWLREERTGAARVAVGDGLLSGLEAAHRVGVTHGDLEPGNVLVTGEGVPKVIGFGLNRALARQAEPGWDTNSGVARSLSYRAPEQARGTGGTRTDVYALGLLLHQLLLDRLPHEPGGSKGLPEAIGVVLRKALATDPAERHVSVWAMRKAWGDAITESREAIDGATKGFGELDAEPTRGGVVVDEPSIVISDDLGATDAVSAGVQVPEEEPPVVAAGVAVPRSDPPIPQRGDSTLAGLGAPAPAVAEDDLRSVASESINPRPGPPAAPSKRIDASASPVEDASASSGRPSEPGMRISLTDVEIEPSPPQHSAPPPPPPASHASPRSDAPPVSLSPLSSEVRPIEEEPPKAFPWPAVVIVLLVLGAGYFAFREQGDDAERRAVIEDPPPVPIAEVAPEPEPVVGPPVRLTLHDLPEESQVTIDGIQVALQGESVSFPNDGRPHALEVRSEGKLPWRQVLAAESPLDLLVVAEPDPDAMEAEIEPDVELEVEPEEVAAPDPQPERPRVTEMRTTPRAPRVRTPATMTTSAMAGRPSISRNPGF